MKRPGILFILALAAGFLLPELCFAHDTIQPPQASSPAPASNSSTPSESGSATQTPGARKQEMLKLFDQNHDGVLDEKEKAQAREYRQQHGIAGKPRGGRRGARRGRRARRMGMRRNMMDKQESASNPREKPAICTQEGKKSRCGTKGARGNLGGGRKGAGKGRSKAA